MNILFLLAHLDILKLNPKEKLKLLDFSFHYLQAGIIYKLYQGMSNFLRRSLQGKTSARYLVLQTKMRYQNLDFKLKIWNWYLPTTFELERTSSA